MNRLFFYIQLIAYLLLFSIISAQTISIEGLIKDKKTKKPLPYSSVVVKEQFLGTMAGPDGRFIIYLPDSLIDDTLQITHLGYKTFERPVKDIANSVIEVRLRHAPTKIDEVVIKPLLPEEVIRLAIQNIDKNYPQKSFITEGFYLEELLENDVYVKFAEAFVEIYSPPFGDTNKCQAKLLQARTRDSLGQIKFLEAFAQKKYKKAKKKADRKGDTINQEDYSGVQVMFGGPKNALLTDFVRGRSMFLDTNNFKKFDFTYERDNSLDGKRLYVIRCKNKRAIDYMYMDALVYIDKDSKAIVKITTNNTVKLPAIAKPFLALYRLKVGEIKFNIDNEYRKFNDKWYPSKVLVNFNGSATKKYSGGKIEHGVFKGSQAFAATNILSSNVKEFSEEERMTNDDLADQMGEYDPTFWENRTKIEYSVE